MLVPLILTTVENKGLSVLTDDKIETEIEHGDAELDESLSLRYSISSYGADYPIDGLVKRLKNGDIYVPTFQRKYVWPQAKASRFIESLLIGLPVPGIFLSKEQRTQKLLIIDGQQRLQSLKFFYDGIFSDSGKQFALSGLKSQFEGLTYSSLRDDDRRRLDDAILHATVVRQDEPSEDDSAIYFVFERLNTGGMQLAPQEIRACVYHGLFNEMLGVVNMHPSWRSVFGKVSKRMRDQELILRFFAMFYEGANYASPMKEFLNVFMDRHRKFEKGIDSEDMGDLFVRTIDCVHRILGDKAFRPVRTLNAAVFDAVMVGLASRISIDGDSLRDIDIKAAYSQLLADPAFRTAIETGTTQEANVKKRIDLAKKAFGVTVDANE